MPKRPIIGYFFAPSELHDDQELHAQHGAIARRAEAQNRPLIGAFSEPEPVGMRSRPGPQLREAIALAQQQDGTLIMSRFSPLARNPTALRTLIEARVEVLALDIPSVSRRTLPLMLSLAENERKIASESTRAGLAKARAQGRKLGANGAIQARLNKAAAFTRVAPLAGALGGLIGEGLSVRAMARRLNEMQIPSPGGGGWHASNVHRALTRLAPERFGKGRIAGS